MRIPRPKVWTIGTLLVLVLVIGSVLLVSAPGPQFTVHDKAYYADANLVNFVRPGLVVQILSASILADGTISTRFKLTDPRGLPLDRLGITTPGSVSMSLVAAYIPQGQTQYVSYTTRVQTSPITGVSAVQAAGENNGTFTQVADGEYVYTFNRRAPADFDRTVTHTIYAYANRNLEEFDLGIHLADDTYNFVPDGSPVTVVRDVVKTATCNKCHQQELTAHGNTGRKAVEGCIVCHNATQDLDPDTGQSIDMVTMTHKIHMGSSLPSVQAGTPYQIIGVRQTVFDFSDVVFPADVRNCTVCHEQGVGAVQEDAYLKPNRVACGSCHDNVNFATGQNHASLPQFTDNLCGSCHLPEGELEFDLSIRGGHTIPRFSRDLPGTVFELLEVTDGMAGQRPTLSFSLKDKEGNAIPPSQMTRLALVLAGPASDYSSWVSEDARQAQGTTDGRYFYTFNYTIPEGATGTYSIGIEGYRNITLLPGTLKEQTVRDAGENRVIHFSVDGSPEEPRRTVAATEKCNDCHYSLNFHGDNRNTVEQCLLCHNPNQTDGARRTAALMPAESVNMALMIHKIHTGHNLVEPYVVYGFGGAAHDYSHVLYPADRRVCTACHVGDSQQLPLDRRLLQVTDPRGLLNPVGPATSACMSCHGEVYAASHALANTTALGESCAACHKPGAQFSVDRVHAK